MVIIARPPADVAPPAPIALPSQPSTADRRATLGSYVIWQGHRSGTIREAEGKLVEYNER